MRELTDGEKKLIDCWMMPQQQSEPYKTDIKIYNPATWFQKHIPFWLYKMFYKPNTILTGCFPISIGNLELKDDVLTQEIMLSYDDAQKFMPNKNNISVSYRNPLSKEAINAFNKLGESK